MVGKRAVVLETGDDFSDLLEPDDVIPLSQTVVYADVPEFGKASDELLSEVDADALNTFLVALTDLTKGQRDELQELVEGGTRLTSVINEHEEPLRELLRRLREFSATLNSRDQELLQIVDDFDVVLGRVQERREDLKRLFRETRRTSAIGADLVADVRPELDAILTEVHKDTKLLARHQMDIAEALAYAPDAIGGFGSISFSGDVPVPYGHVLAQSAGPVGVDVLAGCGGLLDQQLDKLLGKDPRSCEEQENDTFPDDQEEPDTDPIPDLPVGPIDPPKLPKLPKPPAQQSAAPSVGTERLEVDALARSLVPSRGDDR
jgi:phospholipid/cholesterol/gamma-HCH transport system substrate-binding protein